MKRIGKRRVKKKRIRKPVTKQKITKVAPGGRGAKAKKEVRPIPWYLTRLEKPGKSDRVQVNALRRQVKANGRCKMVKCWLVKAKQEGSVDHQT
jgi:hypothetical protein